MRTWGCSDSPAATPAKANVCRSICRRPICFERMRFIVFPHALKMNRKTDWSFGFACCSVRTGHASLATNTVRLFCRRKETVRIGQGYALNRKSQRHDWVALVHVRKTGKPLTKCDELVPASSNRAETDSLMPIRRATSGCRRVCAESRDKVTKGPRREIGGYSRLPGYCEEGLWRS